MDTVLIAFLVGLITLSVGFLLGSARGRMLKREAKQLMDRSDQLMSEMQSLRDKVLHGLDLDKDKAKQPAETGDGS